MLINVSYACLAHVNGNSSSNGVGSQPGRDLTVAEIKDRARASEQEVRGATLHSILRTAKDKAHVGLAREQDGDIRGAFQSLVIAAQLAQVMMNHPEFKQENAKKGGSHKSHVYKECFEFQKVCITSFVMGRLEGLDALVLNVFVFSIFQEK